MILALLTTALSVAVVNHLEIKPATK